MERRRDDAGRQPQFTESQYEIPSWQTPWSKPWYQRTDGSSESEKPRTFKYNSRGHLVDCNCSICEEDLEKAFSPQSNSNQKTLFDIPKDRRQEIKIKQVEDEENGAGEEGSNSARPQNANGLNFGASGVNSDAPKRVYMFSELAEVTQTTTSNGGENSEPRSSNASVREQQDRGATSIYPSNNAGSAASNTDTHESLMEGIGKLTAIQAISNQNTDIQERVRNYRGTSRTHDYRAMKELLESLLRELNRINGSIEWIATAKAIALEGIQKTLQTLEQKVKEAES